MDKQQMAILVPILVPLGVFLMVYGIRNLENQERMAMIQRGIVPPSKRDRQFNPSRTLRNALVLLGAGFGLLAAKIIDDSYFFNDQTDRATPYYFACIAIGAGVGLLSAYVYERKNPPPTNLDKNDDFHSPTV
jgi:hypothetical protein